MRIFTEFEQHTLFLEECINAKPKSVVISTFGLYAGITYSGKDMHAQYPSATRRLLELMRDVPNVRILVGFYNYKSCKGRQDCVDCEKRYVESAIRLLNHADMFSDFMWRATTSSHLKSVLFLYEDGSCKGVAGGRNFTDSEWADVTFELDTDSINTVSKHIRPVWDTAQKLDNQFVEWLLNDQEISPAALESLA